MPELLLHILLVFLLPNICFIDTFYSVSTHTDQFGVTVTSCKPPPCVVGLKGRGDVACCKNSLVLRMTYYAPISVSGKEESVCSVMACSLGHACLVMVLFE